MEQKVKVFKAVKSGTPDKKIGPQQVLDEIPREEVATIIELLRARSTITSTEIDELAEE